MFTFQDEVAAPAADNRVVQVTGLSPEITHHKLLGKIRDAGKVFSLRIIKTLLPGTPTISAGIVMWDWAATRRLVMQVEDGLLNDGHFEASLTPASKPFAMPTQGIQDRSRVLLIRGHPSVVQQGPIVGFLRETIRFDLDQADIRQVGRGAAVMEVRFGGYRGQAELAFEKLAADAYWASQVAVAFGADPCDRR